MKNREDHKIAGLKTSGDWKVARVRLLADEPNAWHEAFTDFYEARLNLRYLHPIKVLQKHGTSEGEGFSIASIQCSLIEFLESSEQGINYRFVQHKKDLRVHEYKSSQGIFVAFLRDRSPFCATFNQASAEDFYSNVRCGLLHEARTKNGWRILARDTSGMVANVINRIVYRDNFQEALLAYISNYGKRLPHEPLLKKAFIRKFDILCE